MDKSGKHYWAVLQGRDILFQGSHSDCWAHLVEQYGKFTVADLVKKGIRIGRCN